MEIGKMAYQKKQYTIDLFAANEGKTLNKPFRTPKGPKKFSVYVKNEKGNVVKVNFGDPNMEIKRDDPNRRKNFRARHNCANPGPKTKARYWSCKMWSKKSVTNMTKGSEEWDGVTFYDHDQLIEDNPSLAYVLEEITEAECDRNGDCGCCEKGDCGCGCHESGAALSEKQKKLPPALQKAILKKKGKKPEEDKSEEDSKDKDDKDDKKDDSSKGLTKEQKKLPPALQKAILKKKSKAELQEEYASLWENIKKKRERIKKGSGEKMRKKGEKGAPTPEQMKKAKDKSKAKNLEDYVALPVYKQKRTVADYSKLWNKVNEK